MVTPKCNKKRMKTYRSQEVCATKKVKTHRRGQDKLLSRDVKTKFQNQLQRTHSRIPVIFFFFFRQFLIRHEARMGFKHIIPTDSILPTMLNAGLSPHLMHIFSHLFNQATKFIRQLYATYIGRIWLV